MPDTLPALEARRSEILRQIGTLGDGVQPLFVFVLDILLHHNERVRKDFGRHPERDAVQRRFRLAFAASQVNFVSNYLHCIFILAVQPVGASFGLFAQPIPPPSFFVFSGKSWDRLLAHCSPPLNRPDFALVYPVCCFSRAASVSCNTDLI
jgi:hypothetical protein